MAQENIQEQENKNKDIIKDTNSYFDGDPWTFFFLKLGLFLLKVVTLWFAQPYCECVKNRYELSHTVVDGRRLKFTGTPAGIWKINILWNIITFFTVFTFSVMKLVKMRKWVVEHTVFEDSENLYEIDEENSKFDGEFKEGAWILIKGFFVTIGTLFILTPLALYWIETYAKNHTYVSGYKLTLVISFKEFFRKWMKWLGLSIVTLGVYLIFLHVKVRRYLNRFTHIIEK